MTRTLRVIRLGYNVDLAAVTADQVRSGLESAVQEVTIGWSRPTGVAHQGEGRIRLTLLSQNADLSGEIGQAIAISWDGQVILARGVIASVSTIDVELVSPDGEPITYWRHEIELDDAPTVMQRRRSITDYVYSPRNFRDLAASMSTATYMKLPGGAGNLISPTQPMTSAVLDTVRVPKGEPYWTALGLAARADRGQLVDSSTGVKFQPIPGTFLYPSAFDATRVFTYKSGHVVRFKASQVEKFARVVDIRGCVHSVVVKYKSEGIDKEFVAESLNTSGDGSVIILESSLVEDPARPSDALVDLKDLAMRISNPPFERIGAPVGPVRFKVDTLSDLQLDALTSLDKRAGTVVVIDDAPDGYSTTYLLCGSDLTLTSQGVKSVTASLEPAHMSGVERMTWHAMRFMYIGNTRSKFTSFSGEKMRLIDFAAVSGSE